MGAGFTPAEGLWRQMVETPEQEDREALGWEAGEAQWSEVG